LWVNENSQAVYQGGGGSACDSRMIKKKYSRFGVLRQKTNIYNEKMEGSKASWSRKGKEIMQKSNYGDRQGEPGDMQVWAGILKEGKETGMLEKEGRDSARKRVG